MGWAQEYISKLVAGTMVRFRPRGNSMTGKVNNGDLVTVVPVDAATELTTGDIVLCRVSGREYLHLIKAVGADGRFQIGNNRGGINGWTSRSSVFGRCIKIEK
jgi:SOS-response transcriptional repressor LexA